MNLGELADTARSLVVTGKGILAADESAPTIEKRFKAIDLPSTEENRRAYRDLLFTTPAYRSHQRRDPLRRNDPATRRGRDAVHGGA